MKELTDIEKVNVEQIEFGARLGLNLDSCTTGVAMARILDAVNSCFLGAKFSMPTPKQIEFAAKFGYDISGVSRQEGDAVVDDIMLQLNFDAIKKERLAPGVMVSNVHDKVTSAYTISSIAKDGTVYFRGGNGKRAWARSLRRIGAS